MTETGTGIVIGTGIAIGGTAIVDADHDHETGGIAKRNVTPIGTGTGETEIEIGIGEERDH